LLTSFLLCPPQAYAVLSLQILDNRRRDNVIKIG